MPDSWIINVAGRAYGPYGPEQMHSFVAEGRLVAKSQIARSGETAFRNAFDDPDLSQLFPTAMPAGASKEFPRLREPERQSSFGKLDETSRDRSESVSQLSHLIIIADMKSRSISRLEEEILKFGQACPVFPQVWLLSTEASVSAIRNQLIQQLGKQDALLVIDATRDKAAWFNFGPEMDARIRRLWSKQIDTTVSG